MPLPSLQHVLLTAIFPPPSLPPLACTWPLSPVVTPSFCFRMLVTYARNSFACNRPSVVCTGSPSASTRTTRTAENPLSYYRLSCCCHRLFCQFHPVDRYRYCCYKTLYVLQEHHVENTISECSSCQDTYFYYDSNCEAE